MRVTLHCLDHRRDPACWARALAVSVDACTLLLDAHFIDLHCDLDVAVRCMGVDPSRHHGVQARSPWFYGHTDFPRLREAAFSGVVYDMPTNPLRRPAGRLRATLANVDRAFSSFDAHPSDLQPALGRADYDTARHTGKTAMWVALQGANAVSADPSVLEGPLGQRLHRITLVHLTTSDIGGTSSPLGRDRGLTDLGREVVARCNAAGILVDLAHAGKRTFWDALDAHAPDLPPIVSHTGVAAVHPHWRNIDDDQIRAVAARGGVVGVIYQGAFLAARPHQVRARILDHLDHICRVAGEGHAAIGTDYDGMIVPPADLPDVTAHPLLVQDMLDRGWDEDRIRGILGESYLRVVSAVRP